MTSRRRPRLLFVQLYPSTFVEDDVEILSPHFDIERAPFGGEARGGPIRRGAVLAAAFARQFWWLIRRLPRADLVYGWFADYHMFLPTLLARIFRRPCVVVLGGFDVTCLPQLGFGVFASRWRAPLGRTIARQARHLLAVTPGLIRSENRFAHWPEVVSDGVLAHAPGLKTPCEVIPTAFLPDRWPPGPPMRGAIISTSAWIASDRTFRIKGIDLVFEVARLVDEAEFRVVGLHAPLHDEVRRRYHPPPNVRLLPPRDRFTLAPVYGETSVYLQPSRTEGGLPMALGEAMLCGCIPVAAAVGGMPDTVGDAGYLVDRPDPGAIAAVVRRALQIAADPVEGPAARERARRQITENFGWEIRRERLLRRLLELAGRADEGKPGGVD